MSDNVSESRRGSALIVCGLSVWDTLLAVSAHERENPARCPGTREAIGQPEQLP